MRWATRLDYKLCESSKLQLCNHKLLYSSQYIALALWLNRVGVTLTFELLLMLPTCDNSLLLLETIATWHPSLFRNIPFISIQCKLLCSAHTLPVTSIIALVFIYVHDSAFTPSAVSAWHFTVCIMLLSFNAYERCKAHQV